MNLLRENKLNKEEILELFEEISELFDVSKANSINFYKFGGLDVLSRIILKETDIELRTFASRLFSSLLGNNLNMQKSAGRDGAVNFAAVIEIEKDPAVKDLFLSCFSAFLKAENFDGKRLYITKFDGLKQLSQ